MTRKGYGEEYEERRFLIAMAVMAALAPGENGTIEGDARQAVHSADALLEELAK